jgi:hypothetical protein
VYSTIITICVPVNVPLIAGLIPVPVVQLAFDTVPVELMAFEEPQVKAPLRIVVPVPAEPNVGLIVVVLLALSLRHLTAVIVRVTPESL